MAHEDIIKKFYTAFSNRDYVTMQKCYHPEATFYDPAFRNLNSTEVRAMWQMLITSSKDLTIKFSDVKSEGDEGSCRWDAYYTFTQTNRKVHNIVFASFKFKDNLILSHQDHFNFWRWSSMALGVPGMLMGWSSFLRNKVNGRARARLVKYMDQ